MTKDEEQSNAISSRRGNTLKGCDDFVGRSMMLRFLFFSSRRRHTRYWRDWSSDVCSSDLSLDTASSGRATGPSARGPATPAASRPVRAGVAQVLAEMVTAGSANIRFAPIAPTMHQATWAGRVGRVGRGITPGRSAERSIDERRDRVEATAGHRPNIRMIANNPAAVAAALSSSSRPVSPGDQPLRVHPGADYWTGH